MDLSKKEREAGGVLDMDTKIISSITSHGPGYLNKDLEQIVKENNLTLTTLLVVGDAIDNRTGYHVSTPRSSSICTAVSEGPPPTYEA